MMVSQYAFIEFSGKLGYDRDELRLKLSADRLSWCRPILERF